MSTNWRANKQGRQVREQILNALLEFIARKGYSPTKAELAKTVGVCDTVVTKHIRFLVAEGKVIDEGPRTLRPSI